MLHPYLCFLNEGERDDVAFIHGDLKDKLQGREEDFDEIQNQEIEFFLKYYYRNRRTYSNK